MTRPVRVSPVLARPRKALLPYQLGRVWRPEIFQGGGRFNDYFEGWYLKCVDAGRHDAVSFIPGVSRDAAGGTSHCFVQVVRPGGITAYVQYPADSFEFDRREFAISVGPNRFSTRGMSLDIDGAGVRVKGELTFGPWRPWPVRLLSPGIMGRYRFVPRMECYHGVCSLDHEVNGSLLIDGVSVAFDGGRGYAEKDWGRSFPSSWIWAQSNHFDRPGTSVTISVAKIPWMGSAFVGSVAGVLLDGELYRFTTYTGAHLTAFESWTGGARLTLEDRGFVLTAELDGATAAPLKAPAHGSMVARADESLDATIRVRLMRRADGATLLDDCGVHAGCEVMDDRGELREGIHHAAPEE